MRLVDRIPGLPTHPHKPAAGCRWCGAKQRAPTPVDQAAWWPKGFARVRINGEVRELSDNIGARQEPTPHHIEVVRPTGWWPVRAIRRAAEPDSLAHLPETGPMAWPLVEGGAQGG